MILRRHHRDTLRADEFRLKNGFSIFQKHCDDLLQVTLKFV